MIVESFGIPPIPSEVILPFAGFLVAGGTFPLVPTAFVAVTGELVGTFVAYAAGRWGRERIMGAGLGALRLQPKHLARMDAFFARRGPITVALARLVPVLRSYVSYPAGAAGMPPVRFGVYTLMGSSPFDLALLYAGFVLRDHWSLISSYFRLMDEVGIAIIAIGVAYILLLVAGLLEPGWPPRRRHRSPSTDGAGHPP
jgi:membrane protein DedA with SNARE-associated domain